jgi:nucleotide-binding universal stress UspA family protein
MRTITRVAVTHVLADARLAGDAEPVAASAVRIARAHRARLTLLHVLPRLPGESAAHAAGAPPGGPLVTRLRGARRRAAFERMVAIHPHEPRMNWLVVEGEPEVEIVRTAVRHAVDLILLDGTRMSAGDEGETARYVIQRAPCRVEVIGGSVLPGVPALASSRVVAAGPAATGLGSTATAHVAPNSRTEEYDAL